MEHVTLDTVDASTSPFPSGTFTGDEQLDEVRARPLARELGLTDEELDRIVETLGRMPSVSELGMYSVMWSEHCSYKSSKVHLRTLPTEGDLILAGVGIANVMYVSVSNATRDIGIRMATGARTHQVLGQYVLEGLLATALGGVLGMGASALLVWGVGQIPMQGDFFDIVGKPLPVLSAQVAAIVIAVLGAIGLAAGYFPARRAAQIDPAVALRQE